MLDTNERCCTCKHWRGTDEDHGYAPCAMANHTHSLMRAATPGGNGYDEQAGTLLAHAWFACVMWEERTRGGQEHAGAKAGCP